MRCCSLQYLLRLERDCHSRGRPKPQPCLRFPRFQVGATRIFLEAMMLFVTARCMYNLRRMSFGSSVVKRHIAHTACTTRRKALMCSEVPRQEPSDSVSGTMPSIKKTPTEIEKETPISAWGVVSFLIIMVIFALGVLSTVARDFVPSGLAPPV